MIILLILLITQGNKLKPTNSAEKNLTSLLRDINDIDLNWSQIIELITEFSYPDPTNNWDVNSACVRCPPEPARLDLVKHIYKQIKESYCEHTDSAIPVAEYIVSEIKNNTRSEIAREIRDFNSYELALKEYNETPFTYQHLIGMDTILANNALKALHKFAYIIGDKRPWDHKPILREIFKDMGVERPNDFNGIDGALSSSFYTKYKDYDYFYDVWSNIHYGYVGKSIGFSTFDLVAASNIQQIYHDKSLMSGDTGSDKATILIGINLYEKYGLYADNLTALDILEALDSDEALHSSLNKESKQTHWCWHSKNENKKGE